MVKTATAQLFVNTPEYIEEVTEGTIPTNPAMISCGPVENLALNIDGTFVDVSQLGPEDLVAILAGLNKYEFKMKCFLTASTFMKYGLSAANYGTPAGTISAPLSIAWSVYLNGVINYIVASGCRAKDMQFIMEAGKADYFEITFIAMNIAVPTSVDYKGSGSHAAVPTGPVWGHLDGASNPVAWNASGLNAKKISITINRSTSADYTTGNSNAFGTQPHGRRISFEITNLWTASTLETDFRGGTTRTLAVVIKTATSTITFTSAYLTSYKRDGDANATDSIAEIIQGRALAVSVT